MNRPIDGKKRRGKTAPARPTTYKVYRLPDYPPEHPRSRHSCARRFTQLRMALGFNQNQFSRQIHVPRTSVNQIEAGIVRPSLQTAIILKDYTRVTLDWLYTGDESGLSQATLDMLRKIDYNSIPMPHGQLPPGRKGSFR